ncbi:MAG: universal stress protein [Bacteroidetes bacterium]|nr:universal stress protein [Bacteroidota bacterium]HET6245151.1 universal stress protein [Bacteroidia bacterium]
MKKILVPADFSPTAENAMKYAINFAKKFQAEIVFFYSSHIPVITPGIHAEAYEEMVEKEMINHKNKLEHLTSELCEKAGFEKDSYTSIVGSGFAGDEIPEIVQKQNCDLIIMGTTGAGGLKKLFGSITYHIIKLSTTPVIAIPDGFPSHVMPTKIVLATDYKGPIPHMELLQEISLVNNSDLLIFNVQKEQEYSPSIEEAIQGLAIEDAVKSVNHSYHFSVDDNVTESIKDFTEKENANLLVIIPHEHDFFERIFGISTTKELAHSANIPLFIITENTKK